MARRSKKGFRFRGKGKSIHPRVVKGRTKFDKVNTARVADGSKRASVIAGLERQVAEQPNNMVAKRRLAKLEAA